MLIFIRPLAVADFRIKQEQLQEPSRSHLTYIRLRGNNRIIQDNFIVVFEEFFN